MGCVAVPFFAKRVWSCDAVSRSSVGIRRCGLMHLGASVAGKEMYVGSAGNAEAGMTDSDPAELRCSGVG